VNGIAFRTAAGENAVVTTLSVLHRLAPTDRAENRLTASMCVAVAVIAVFNLADIVTTRAVLARGAIESNPLASFLLTGHRVELVKVMVLLALIYRVPRRTPTIAFHALLWFVAGFYALTVLSNLLVLQRIG